MAISSKKIKAASKKIPSKKQILEDFKDEIDFGSNDKTETPKLIKRRTQYPSPKPKSKTFTEKWNEFIEDVAERENFKTGHLSQLCILCDLYVELEVMEDLIRKNGYTYTSASKNGIQIKPRPEVTQKNKILSEIRSYSKVLGLLLVKDTKFTDPDEAEENWS